jgi:aminoglycoside phosphotransferase (APT) family kinase protein
MEEKILVPHIYHVREATDEVMGVIVMEDLTEKGHKSPVIANVELIKEVVKALACLHSASLRNRTFTTVPPLPSRHFERLSANYRAVVALFVEHNIDTTLLRSSRELFTAESMISTVEGAAEKLGCETVLVHGMVTRENIFVVNKDDQRVLALIDWKGCTYRIH